MMDEELLADGHQQHPKHLQLGVDPDDVGNTDRTPLLDPDAIDVLWADATTVEQFKADIERLAAEATPNG